VTRYHPLPSNVADSSHSSEAVFDEPNEIPTEDPEISVLMGYIKRLKVTELFEEMRDPRKGNLDYSLSSILSVALSVVLFRRESKNAFYSEVKKVKQSEVKFADFCGCENERIPAPKTVDDVLKKLEVDEANEILMAVFEKIRLSKLFSKNKKAFLPNNMYCVAIDGEVIHRYNDGCDHDCENCPYCLKRQRGETIWYHHIIAVASLVTPQGLKFPLFVYPIHAKAVDQSQSDDKLKQECESKALPKILRALRTRFPRLNICILLDALYATAPSIQVCKDHNVEFSIVRKSGNMRTVGEDCDGLAKLSEHKEFIEKTEDASGNTVERKYKLFNNVSYRGHNLNLVRFEEVITKKSGKEVSRYKGEWITSWRLHKKNCGESVGIGRLRWDEEDLFNTVENRGLNMRHDYSRNPNAQIVWTILIMLSISITECFTNLCLVSKSLKGRAIVSVMKDLFFQLKYMSHSLIFGARCLLQSVQFRFALGSSP
jgi:hypothetical protein